MIIFFESTVAVIIFIFAKYTYLDFKFDKTLMVTVDVLHSSFVSLTRFPIPLNSKSAFFVSGISHLVF